NMRQKFLGGDVDRVAAGRLDDGNARRFQLFAEVLNRADAVAEIVFLQGLVQTDGDRLHVVAGQAAVGGEALGQDEQVAALFDPCFIVQGQKAADVGHA